MADRVGPAPSVERGRHLDKIHAMLMAQADAAGRIDWSVNVDSTINRAHQHGTNLPRDTGGTTELQQSAPGVA